MTDGPRFVPRAALDGLLKVERPIESLGRAVWLYVALVSAASKEGRVCRTLDRLSKTLGASQATVSEWLDKDLFGPTFPDSARICKTYFSKAKAKAQKES